MQSLRNCISAFKFLGSSLGAVSPTHQVGVNLKPALGAMITQQRNLSTLNPRTSSALNATPTLSLSTSLTSASSSIASNKGSFLQPASTSSFTSIIRTAIRNHFPKPSEVRRIRRHGLKHRLKTKGGREIILKRILKGRYNLAHGW